MKTPNEGRDWSDKTVFSTGEAAQICRVSQQTIIRCFDSGKLQGFRVPGSKFRRIPRDELIRFMRENGIPVSEIDRSRRRVLTVHGGSAEMVSLEQSLGRLGRVDLCVARGGFEAGWHLAVFRPHLVIVESGDPSCTAEMVRTRVDESFGADRPVIAFVSPGAPTRRSPGEGGADWSVSIGGSTDSVASDLLGLVGGAGREETDR